MIPARLRSLLAALTILAAAITLPMPAHAAGATAPPPIDEALQNPSLEGTASRANGFELFYAGAQTSPLAHSGTQAVDLGKGGATPQPWYALGMVRAYAAHPAALGALTGISYQFEAPNVPARISFQEILLLDSSGAGVPDTCLFTNPHAIPTQPGYALYSMDLSQPFQAGDAGCTGGPSLTLASLLAAHPATSLLSFAVQTYVYTPSAAWPQGAPILVDDLSISTAAIRISPASSDACAEAAHPTVQEAIGCAAAGATVLVAPGTYAGFDVTKPLTVCATSIAGAACSFRSDVIVDGPASRLGVVQLLSADSRLDGIVVQNPNLTATDQSSGGPTTAALVVVAGDRAGVSNATLRNLGAQPGALQSRWRTMGIDVESGTDVQLLGNMISGLAAGRGTDGTCLNLPCADYGIFAQPSTARLDVESSSVKLATGSSVRGIHVASPHATIYQNLLTLHPNLTASPVDAIGIEGWGPAANLSLNVLVSSSPPSAATLGILVVGQDVVLFHNVVSQFERGIQANLTGGANLTGNVFGNVGLPILISGGAPALWGNFIGGTTTTSVSLDGISAAVFSQNHLKGATTLSLGPGVHNLTLDARRNDWGVYSRAAILGTIADGGKGDSFDVRCYIDKDIFSNVCPPTPAFTTANSTWARPIAFTDASRSGGRPLANWSWSFSDGAQAWGANVSHTFAAPGTATATLAVTDTDGWTSTLTQPVLVTDAAPVLASVGDQAVIAHHDLTLQLQASDPDNDSLTYSASGIPPGATFNATSAVFHWQPDFTQEGVWGRVNFSVTDGWRVATQLVNVTVGYANAPPTLSFQGPTNGSEGQALGFLVLGRDVDGDPVSLYTTVLPAGASFLDLGNGTGQFSWSPDFTQAGDYPITFQASDGENLTETTLTVHIANVDRAPVFQPIPTTYGTAGQPVQLQVTAMDPDGDPVTYSARNLPPGASFDASNGVLRWVPTLSQRGTFNVTFVASDGTLATSAVGCIVITRVDRAPVLQPIADVTALSGTTLTVALNAADPDGDSLTFTVSQPGMTVQGASLVWRTRASDVGNYTIQVVASDGNLTATRTLNVTLQVNQPPAIALFAPTYTLAATPTGFSAYGTHDPDGNDSAIQYAWCFNGSAGFQPMASGANVTWTFHTVGNQTVTLRATDEAGVVSYRNVTVFVDEKLVLYVVASVDASGQAHATVTIRDEPFVPLAGIPFTLNVTMAASQGAPRVLLHTLQGTTGPNGVAVVSIPEDLPTGDVPGTHYVEASATLAKSMGGRQQQASASAGYSPVLLSLPGS